jgi:hypothetical protein
MALTNFHVSPVCSSTRAALLPLLQHGNTLPAGRPAYFSFLFGGSA